MTAANIMRALTGITSAQTSNSIITKMSFGSLVAFVVSLFAMLSPLGSLAYAEEVPPWVEIRELLWAGSGCPAGSVASSIASDYKAFSLAFDSYIASAGPDIPITENRKNCNLIIRLSFPSGWSFTIFNMDYRGFASLDEHVDGKQRSAYFFEGQYPSSALQTTLVGPYDDNYEIGDTVDLAVYSPCGEDRALNINTEVRVNNRKNRNGYGLMTTDTITGELLHIYRLKWRKCY
jgi:hypothetical protein